MRLRKLVVQPGGIVPNHSHAERPSNIYVVDGAITEYRFDPAHGRDAGLVLARYNVTAPMDVEATPVTAEPDHMVAARG